MISRANDRDGWPSRRAVGGAGLLAALLTVTLCGCSGTGSAAVDEEAGGAALRIVRQAADVLVEAGSSRARTAMRMASGGTRITISGEGGFDYDRRLGELRLTLPAPVESSVPGEPVTEVFAPGELYMRNRGAGVPPEKWVRVEVTSVADGNLVTGGATDPITAAELLRGARSAEDLGTRELNGETLHHYRGVTDIAAASEASRGEARQQFAAAVAGEGFTRTRVPFDAYLDDQGLLRRVRHQFSFAREGETVHVASTVELYGFGSPVDVELPRSEDVYAGMVTASQGES
ncbi:hypothetical protein ACTWP5_03925 [Streptomyces sp. 4N509B]|uniref:hypothetical protein n=1 Tax=Streptomyces sp. 4N509B TaxID=3457413 RepID=UPI003FD3D7DF